MTAQLQLDIGARRATPIEHRLLEELDYLHRNPADPSDVRNAEAHAHLVAGIELQLGFLATADPLPDEPLEWPCGACFAAVGEPCDIPGRRDKWTSPGPRYHTCRGTMSKWGSTLAVSTRGGAS